MATKLFLTITCLFFYPMIFASNKSSGNFVTTDCNLRKKTCKPEIKKVCWDRTYFAISDDFISSCVQNGKFVPGGISKCIDYFSVHNLSSPIKKYLYCPIDLIKLLDTITRNCEKYSKTSKNFHSIVSKALTFYNPSVIIFAKKMKIPNPEKVLSFECIDSDYYCFQEKNYIEYGERGTGILRRCRYQNNKVERFFNQFKERYKEYKELFFSLNYAVKVGLEKECGLLGMAQYKKGITLRLKKKKT